MISYIFIPKGDHQDDVSFLEMFLVDNILIERKVNMGYIIFRHMKACSLSEDLVLPYGMFITKIVKYFNVNLWNETDGKKLKSFDTYIAVSLQHIHFVQKKDGSWERKSSVPPSEVYVSSDNGLSQDEEYENQDVEARTSENANVTSIPSKDGAEASDNLTAQISSLGTRLEEMALANDRCFTSLEIRIDGFQEEFKAGHRLIIGSRVPMMAGEANKFGGFVYDVLIMRVAQFADILIYKNLSAVPKSYNGRVVLDEIYSFTPSWSWNDGADTFFRDHYNPFNLFRMMNLQTNDSLRKKCHPFNLIELHRFGVRSLVSTPFDERNRCHQIGKNLSTTKCNVCCSSSTLATCLDCSTVICDK
uniref:Uncharacterized protein n=1 Tax=Vitis vinifera TaxID=29760 RepID=A5B1M2_VITVI|nr:hypothetical protein VITISV_025965 [Vitis vinifera]